MEITFLPFLLIQKDIKYFIFYKLFVYVVLIGSFTSGISFGWLPPTLQQHKNSNGDFSLTDNECNWMVSLQYLGFPAGCLLLISIADRFGRKVVMILSEVMAALSWIGVIAAKSVTLHLLIRLCSGVSVGLNIPILAVYIGENSSPTTRGVFGSCAALFMYAGMLFGCIIPTYYSYETTSYILTAVSLVNLASGVLIREPAHYLLSKGRTVEAENQFFWLRGKDEAAQKEFNDIKSRLTTEKPKFSLSVLNNRYFLIACTSSVLIFFTGYPALSVLVSLILVPTKELSANELAILFELLLLIGAFVSPFIIDCFGRRTLWIVSAVLIAILNFLTAALFFAREKGIEIPNDNWLLFATLCAYAGIFSCTMWPLSILARTELLTQKTRTFGSSASSLLNSLTGFIVAHMFFWIADNFGMQMNFIIYGVSSLLILVFCYFYLPETKGKSLIEIEKMLENPHQKITCP